MMSKKNWILFTLNLGFFVAFSPLHSAIQNGKENVENLVSQEYGDELISTYFKFFHYVDIHPFFEFSAQNPTLNQTRYKFSEIEGRKRNIQFQRPGFYGDRILDLFSSRTLSENFKDEGGAPPDPEAIQFDLNELEPDYSTLNDDIPIVEEDITYGFEEKFQTRVVTEPKVILRLVEGDENRAVHKDGGYPEGDIQIGVDSQSKPGESLQLRMRGFWNNEERLYRTRFIPTDFLIEARTPHALINMGDNYPDFSKYSFNNHFFGFYGVKNWYQSNIFGAFGLKFFRQTDRNVLPAVVQGVRFEHYVDKVYRLGLNYSNSADRTDLPNSNQLLPPSRNQLFSFDAQISPTRDFFMDFEIAGSRTDFNIRDGFGDQSDSAGKFIVHYTYNQYRIETGFERAGPNFFSANGLSPRDEESVYQNLDLRLNKYFDALASVKYSRDNIDDNKVRTIKTLVPRGTLRVHPSEYYRFLRMDLVVEPKSRWSNDDVVDQDHGHAKIELFQKAGQFEYEGTFGVQELDDRFNSLNNRNSDHFLLTARWLPQKRDQIYLKTSLLKDHFVTLNQFDRIYQNEFGFIKEFDDQVILSIGFLLRQADIGIPGQGHHNRRVTLGLEKSFFKEDLLKFEAAYDDYDYETDSLSYGDHRAEISWRHLF